MFIKLFTFPPFFVTLVTISFLGLKKEKGARTNLKKRD